MELEQRTTRLVAGCMTGTSMDGLDAALVEIEGTALAMRPRYLAHVSLPLGQLADGLRALASRRASSARRISELARALGQLHLSAVRELESHLPAGRGFDLISIHGQTIHHAPPHGWQLIDPTPVAHGLGVPVVFDLRSADLEAGGQGAPITPLADFLCFRRPDETRAILNLGGFANYTLLPPSSDVTRVRGGDICACNQLLDALARRLCDRAFDEGGRVAAGGQVRSQLYSELSARLLEQARSGRSLGSGDELADSSDRLGSGIAAADVLRTAAAAVARAIGETLRAADRVLVAGGGSQNATLVGEISRRLGAPLEPTDLHGLPAQAREAAEIAVLGALCQDREPITLEQITGCPRAPVAGCWVLP